MKNMFILKWKQQCISVGSLILLFWAATEVDKSLLEVNWMSLFNHFAYQFQKLSSMFTVMRGEEARGGDVYLSSQPQAFVSIGLDYKPPSSVNPCPRFALHSLDVCFLFKKQLGAAASVISKESTELNTRKNISHHRINRYTIDEEERFHIGTLRCVIWMCPNMKNRHRRGGPLWSQTDALCIAVQIVLPRKPD